MTQTQPESDSMTAMTHSDTQPDAPPERKRRGMLSMFLSVLATCSFVCAAIIIAMLVFGVLGTWGIYLGFVTVVGAPAGFFVMAQRGGRAQVLPMLLPFICMMAGVVGLLVSVWHYMELFRH